MMAFFTERYCVLEHPGPYNWEMITMLGLCLLGGYMFGKLRS
jgi:hypothetical protein